MNLNVHNCGVRVLEEPEEQQVSQESETIENPFWNGVVATLAVLAGGVIFFWVFKNSDNHRVGNTEMLLACLIGAAFLGGGLLGIYQECRKSKD